MISWNEADRFLMGEAETGSRVSDHLRVLCQDIGPRWGGSPSERRAAEYVAGQFGKFGLAGPQLEEFAVDTWESQKAAIRVAGRRGWRVDVRPTLFCPACDLTGPLVEAGFGYERQIESARERIKGPIVLVDPGLEPFTAPRSFTLRLEDLARLGAAAAIAVSGMAGRRTQHFSATDWRDGWPLPAPLPVVQTSREDGRRLAALAVQGVNVTVHVDASFARGRSVNAVSELQGDEWPEEHIVLGAHHDTTPDSPGANDNASGVSVVLEAVRLLAALRSESGMGPGRTIRFVTFGSEEQTLQGSSAYVAEHYGPEDRPRIMINLDELATGDMKGVALQFPELRPLVQDALDSMNEGLRCHVMAQFDASGDMFPFARAGIPSGMLWRWRFVGRHPDAAFGHSSADTIDKVRVSELRDYAGLLARLLLRLSHIPPKSWPPNRLDPVAIARQIEAERGTVIRTM